MAELFHESRDVVSAAFSSSPYAWNPISQRSARGGKNRRKSRFRKIPILNTLSPSVVVSGVSFLLSLYCLTQSFGVRTTLGVMFILTCHEFGHVAALKVFKVPALAPIFFPWVGAFIVMLEEIKNARIQAWIGISGPIAGIAATLGLHLLASRLQSIVLFDVIIWGYGFHLFNLIPAGTLDGGHIAGFVGRWLWIPGAVIFAYNVFWTARLPWFAWISMGIVTITVVYQAIAVFLERSASKRPARSGDTPRAATLGMWLMWLGLLGICGCGLYVGKMQRSDLKGIASEVR